MGGQNPLLAQSKLQKLADYATQLEQRLNVMERNLNATGSVRQITSSTDDREDEWRKYNAPNAPVDREDQWQQYCAADEWQKSLNVFSKENLSVAMSVQSSDKQ